MISADRISKDGGGGALGKRMQLRNAPGSVGRDRSEFS